MFGKKAKELEELRELLSRRNEENELMKKRIGELEKEVDRLKEQESLVLRSITDANRTAARIEDEANAKRDELVAEAEEKVRSAEEKANEMLSEAEELAQMTKEDAEKYSDGVRTDANVYVERTIFASQSEVNRRKDVVGKLNELLKKTTEYLEGQTAEFNRMLASVMEETDAEADEMTKEFECSCNCKECANPCAKANEGGDEDEEEDEGEGEDAVEAEAEPAPEPTPEPEAEPSAAQLDEGEAPRDEEVDASKLPEEYSDPAVLMKNIYYLQQRELPVNKNLFSDRIPAGGVTFEDELGSEETPEELPHEKELAEAVSNMGEAS